MLIAISSLFFLLFLRNFTTIFHELGHAIPSLMFSNDPVKMYIGSYGDTSKSLTLKTGRLTSYIKLNLFEWNLGMVTHGEIDDIAKRLIIIIAGPIASLLIAVPLFIVVLQRDMPEIWIIITCLFIMAAMIDFFVNIIPRSSTKNDGSFLLSDGMQLQILWGRRTLSDDYQKIEKLIEEEKYDEVITSTNDLLRKGNEDKKILYLLVQALEEKREYQLAVDAYNEYSSKFKYGFIDFRDLGKFHCKLNQYDGANHYLDMCFKENFGDTETLLYLGKVRMGEGRVDEALKYFNSALNSDSEHSEVYLERAKACIQAEDYAFAMRDLERAAVSYQNGEIDYWTGIIHEKRHEQAEAYKAFKAAKAKGFSHHALEYKIAMNEERSF